MDPLNLPADHAEFVPYLNAIDGILTWLHNDKRSTGKSGTLVDYGCGSGPWSLVGGRIYDAVVGIDVLEHQLAHGRDMAASNGLANVRFLNLLTEAETAIGKIDAMIAIGFMPVARGDHVHQMFDFAQHHLVPGGRFLILAYRPVVFFDQIMSLEHFSYVPFGQALWRYAATARSALETIYAPKIANTPRARAYQAPRGMIELGVERGMRLAGGPDELAKLDFFQAIDSLFSGTAYRRHVRWANWYLFEAR